jgi:hypothetical protein
VDDDAISILRDEIRSAGAEAKELRLELQQQRESKVGWDDFNKLVTRVTEVEKVCGEYNTERKHLVELADLERVKTEILEHLTELEKERIVSDWSWCNLKKLLSLPVVQLIIAAPTVLLGGNFALPMSGRLFEAGYISKDQILPATLVIFIIVFTLIVIVPIVYVKVRLD